MSFYNLQINHLWLMRKAYHVCQFAEMSSLQNGEEVLKNKCLPGMKALFIANSTLFTELRNPSRYTVRMFPISQIVRFVVKKLAKICRNCS